MFYKLHSFVSHEYIIHGRSFKDKWPWDLSGRLPINGLCGINYELNRVIDTNQSDSVGLLNAVISSYYERIINITKSATLTLLLISKFESHLTTWENFHEISPNKRKLTIILQAWIYYYIYHRTWLLKNSMFWKIKLKTYMNIVSRLFM